MIKMTFRSNVREVIADLRAAESEVRGPAMVRALNKMADRVKVAASREIKAAGYKLKSSVIKDGLRVQRASGANLRSAVIARGRPIPIIEYSARQTARGVSVAVLNGRKVIKSAFIATMSTGHRGVFTRDKGAKHKRMTTRGRTSWHALPITEIYGPKLPDGLANAKVQEALQQLVLEVFGDIYEHEVEWLMRRRR